MKHKTPLENVNWWGVNKEWEYLVQISRWCIHNCSYCWTKRAIWYVKSRKIKDIKQKFKYAIKEWYTLIKLISDDISSYGKDLWIDFADLFNSLCEINGDYKINLDYTEMSEFKKIFNKMKHNFYKVNEIILPIQSLSNKILLSMNKKYNQEEFLEFLKEIRNINYNLFIETIIIYCYPWESEEKFLKNIKWAKYFDRSYAFIYSYREWTKKYPKNELIKKEEKIKRIAILKELAYKYPKRYENKFFNH